MSKYPSTNITLASLEDKGMQVKIKDTAGNSWFLWKADYNNKTEDSEAWSAIQNMKMGETFGITYGEKDESFQGRDGKQVNFTRRTIFSVLPQVSNPTNLSKVNPLYTKPVSVSVSESEPKGDKFWDMKAYKQCLWNFWLENYKEAGTNLNKEDKDLVWVTFRDIEEDAKKRFFDFSASVPKASEPLPVIDSETPANSFGDGSPIPEEINVEDIPF